MGTQQLTESVYPSSVLTRRPTPPDSLRVEPEWTGNPSITVAHDYVTQRGGGERVALALLEAFPGAPLVTSVYHPATSFVGFADHDVHTSWLQRIPVARRDPRLALPLLPAAWKNVRVADDTDVVIASSTGFAHAVRTKARKIVYCHNPPRWLYQTEDYLLQQPRVVRAGLKRLRPYLHREDQIAAASADRYIANSVSVAARIKDAYGIDARVIFPPVTIDADDYQEPVRGLEPGFFLTVSRPRGYKNCVVACEAVEAVPGARLVVVGGLPPHPTGREWSSAITDFSHVRDSNLRWLYANCQALIAPAFEDFGLTPVEAAIFGKPTVALRGGGYLDTVVDGVTGVFADTATSEEFAGAIERLQRRTFSPDLLQTHGKLFGMERFIGQMRHQIADVLAS